MTLPLVSKDIEIICVNICGNISTKTKTLQRAETYLVDK
jgi:hypothetical protein